MRHPDSINYLHPT